MGMEKRMQICRLYKRHLTKMLDLVRHVFDECDRKDYEEQGIRTFEYFIRRENMEQYMESGDMVFFGAYVSSQLVGVVAMRNGVHISLLFVDKEYQRKGVAKCLVRRAAAYSLQQDPALKHITVNASPNGVPAYLAMGFYPLSTEQKKEGMRFTPMRIDL